VGGKILGLILEEREREYYRIMVEAIKLGNGKLEPVKSWFEKVMPQGCRAVYEQASSNTGVLICLTYGDTGEIRKKYGLNISEVRVTVMAETREDQKRFLDELERLRREGNQ
jgi:hypothetical protein